MSLELSGEKPYLVMGLFEDGQPTEGAGSNSLAMRSKAGDGLASPRPTFVCAHCGHAMTVLQVFLRDCSIRAPPP